MKIETFNQQGGITDATVGAGTIKLGFASSQSVGMIGAGPCKLEFASPGKFTVNAPAEVSQMQFRQAGEVICRVTPEGRVIAGEKDVTDDDAELAKLFVKLAAIQGVTVERGTKTDE